VLNKLGELQMNLSLPQLIFHATDHGIPHFASKVLQKNLEWNGVISGPTPDFVLRLTVFIVASSCVRKFILVLISMTYEYQKLIVRSAIMADITRHLRSRVNLGTSK